MSIKSQAFCDYVDALIMAMGSNYTPNTDTAWAYHMTILPTFHDPCCLLITTEHNTTMILITILTDRQKQQNLFDMTWSPKEPPRYLPSHTANMRCLEAMETVSDEARVPFEQQLTQIKPHTLPDYLDGGRDGVVFRCQQWKNQQEHLFWLHSPTTKTAPQHTAFVQLMLNLVHHCIKHQEIRTYLEKLKRYIR